MSDDVPFDDVERGANSEVVIGREGGGEIDASDESVGLLRRRHLGVILGRGFEQRRGRDGLKSWSPGGGVNTTSFQRSEHYI